MSFVALSLDGPRVVPIEPGIDDIRLISRHCRKSRSRWMEAAYIALIANGWSEEMLAELQLSPQGTWYALLRTHQLRPTTSTTPARVLAYAGEDPKRWILLAMATLADRGWSLKMLSALFSVSFATAYRWLRTFEESER